MGRRKIPKTLEEIRSEKSYYEKKRKQEENRMNVRRRIEIGLNSELNSRLLPTRLRSIVCDCEHMPE